MPRNRARWRGKPPGGLKFAHGVRMRVLNPHKSMFWGTILPRRNTVWVPRRGVLFYRA